MSAATDPTPNTHYAAFRHLAEGALWVGKDGKISAANPAAATLLGYPPAELLRRSYLEIDPNYSLLGWKKFWKQLDPGRGESLATQFVNARGSLVDVRGRLGFDPAVPDRCLVVFRSGEEGQRGADLLLAAQEDAGLAVWEYNVATGQVYVAPLLRQWLGWSPERDFYDRDTAIDILSRHLPPGQQKELTEAVHRLLNRAGTQDAVIGTKIAEQPAAKLLLRARSVEDEFEVRKLYGTAQLLTEDAAPTTTAALPERTLDLVHDGVLWLRYADGRIAFANERAAGLTGYPVRELTGQTLADLTDPAFHDELTALYKDVAEHHYLEAVLPTLRKDGSAYPTLATFHFLRDGEEDYLVVVSQDATETARGNEQRQLHATTLNALSEWVIWLDADHRVVLLNAAARKKLSRRTSRDLRGLPVAELMPELDVPPLSQVRQEEKDGRARADLDYVYPDTNGRERTLRIRFVQITGARRRYLGLIARDVTAETSNRRRLQEAKRRVDELHKQLEAENEALKEEIGTATASGPIITVSPKYRQVLAQIGQVAGTNATVLVTGETGTGKELLAQSIHNFSERGNRRLVSVNCAALPDNLIESELFGHERGAFTGAFAQKKGKFELADGGTLFLDEIGELPLDMQAKLLRTLQEGEVQRIGSADVLHVDVRVVAATNRDLERMVNEGTFREDLFYRLNVFPIHNLPLRERPEDIPVLVKHFTRLYAERMGRVISDIRQQDLEALRDYAFPGNIRELINLVERAVITSTTTTLNLGGSLQVLRRSDRPAGGGPDFSGPLVSFEEMQRRYISATLRRTNGKVTGPGGAAEILAMNGRTLMSKMVKLGIDRADFVGGKRNRS